MSGHVAAVSDANVIIDIECGGLTNSMFSLSNASFCVPDVLFEQELRESHSHLLGLGLTVCAMSSDSIVKVTELARKHRKVSRVDLFALQLAIDNSAILLTGDKALCKVAEDYQIECHGTIWLVEYMIKQQVIQVNIAKNAYKLMRLEGSRLPWEETERRLEDIERDLIPRKDVSLLDVSLLNELRRLNSPELESLNAKE